MERQILVDEQIIQAVKKLPYQKIQEVLEYVDFLKWKETKEAVEFDEWALNLAKERGFDHLNEEDVARIVHECRKETQ